MSLFGNNILRGASGAVSDYEIERSLRLDSGDSTHLTRTPGSNADLQKQTYSFWTKRTKTDEAHYIITAWNGSNTDRIGFTADAQFFIEFKDGGSTEAEFHSDRKIRDPNAWYHVVVAIDTTLNTAADRVKAYINGEQITSWDTNNQCGQNYSLEGFGKSSQYHVIGAYAASASSASSHFNGYITEFHFIDGAQKVPGDFAETHADTGAWVPKAYAGTYGSQGWYVNFSDNSNTTAATLGKDSSGNGLNWTPSGLATGDSVGDSPTNNFATLMMQRQPFESGCTLTQGNLHFNSGTGTSARNMNKTSMSNYLVNSGKWYAEFWFTSASAGNFVGVTPYEDEAGSATSNGAIYGSRFGNGNKYIGDGVVSYPNNYWDHGSSYGDGDVIMVMLDMDSSPPRMYTGKNGQWADGSGNDDEAAPNDYLTLGNNFLTTNASMAGYLGFLLVSAGSASNCNAIANFGQDSTFAGRTTAGGNTDSEGYGNFKYTVPTGAKCMCSNNLPEPTIKNGSDYFNTVLYEGTGSKIDYVSVGFQPDMTWIKNRDDTDSHVIQDSERGDYILYPDTSQVEGASGGGWVVEVSDGFTADANGPINTSGESFVGWCWKKSATSGFDMVTYSGNDNADRDISHSLGVIPDLWIVKSRTNTQNWLVGLKELGAGGYMSLETNGAFYSGTGADIPWSNEMPTSAHFTVGENGAGWATNESGENYVAYLWANVAGYQQIGKYLGTGNSDGIFVYTGFKPAFVLIKSSSNAENWTIFDSARDPDNYVHHVLKPDVDTEENSTTTARRLDFVSNGFKIRGTDGTINTSNYTYIYMAIAETSYKYATAR